MLISRKRSCGWSDTGQHTHKAAQIAHFFYLRQLIAQIFQSELAFHGAFGGFFRFFLVDGFGGSLDQADNVAHAENAPGNPFRLKDFKGIQFFADAHQLNRTSGDRAQCSWKETPSQQVPPPNLSIGRSGQRSGFT